MSCVPPTASWSLLGCQWAVHNHPFSGAISGLVLVSFGLHPNMRVMESRRGMIFIVVLWIVWKTQKVPTNVSVETFTSLNAVCIRHLPAPGLALFSEFKRPVKLGKSNEILRKKRPSAYICGGAKADYISHNKISSRIKSCGTLLNALGWQSAHQHIF